MNQTTTAGTGLIMEGGTSRPSRPVISNQELWEEVDEDLATPSSAAGPSTPPRRASKVLSDEGKGVPATPKRPGTPTREWGSPATRRTGLTPVRKRNRPAPAIRQALPVSKDPPSRASRPSSNVKGATGPSVSVLKLLLAVLKSALSILASSAIFGARLTAPFLLPLIAPILGVLLLSGVTYLVLPVLPGFILRHAAGFFRSTASRLLQNSLFSSLSDSSLTKEISILPLRALVATPSCALLGSLCHLSILTPRLQDSNAESSGGNMARPFWKWSTFHIGQPGVLDDIAVGRLARGLSKEVKQASTIFDSLTNVGEHSLSLGSEYVRIWELGVAVQTGSNLDDRGIIGDQLMQLGDMTRDLYDDMAGINSMAINSFTWIQWEFASLVRLIDPAKSQAPSNETVSRRLHTLITRIDDALHTLHSRTDSSARLARKASDHGAQLQKALYTIKGSLQREHDKSPIWRRAYEVGKHQLVGGEPSRVALISRDLDITRSTITELHHLVTDLERVRGFLQSYRDQVGMSQASLMGLHLGAEMAGVHAEEEVEVLGNMVSRFGEAIDEAKRSGRGPAKQRQEEDPKAIDS